MTQEQFDKSLFATLGWVVAKVKDDGFCDVHDALSLLDDVRGVVAERDLLREALKEAISEIGCLVHPEFMSDSKWKQHKLWIDSLKAALQEAGDDTTERA